MGNFHHNGPEPEVMTQEEHDKQAELWEATGGHIREDGPHGGADYDHEHWYDGNDMNNDFVVVIQDDPPEDTETTDASQESDNEED